MTSEDVCIRALLEAADRLGESPTKAQYEDLGLTPSASTILRVMGGWNDAKAAAGLERNRSTGSRVKPKPDDVTIPDEMNWEALSQDQRWHYRNIDWNTERTLRRRAELRRWVNEQKASRGCNRCDTSDPACLDFHHIGGDEKGMAITEMVTHGYSKANLRTESEKCVVLCANCHRKEHRNRRKETGRSDDLTKRERLKQWSIDVRRTEGCHDCSETDPACLEFHHTDPTTKHDTIGNMIAGGYSEEEIRAEVTKCIVLCANCHRKEHFEPPGDTSEHSEAHEQR